MITGRAPIEVCCVPTVTRPSACCAMIQASWQQLSHTYGNGIQQLPLETPLGHLLRLVVDPLVLRAPDQVLLPEHLELVVLREQEDPAAPLEDEGVLVEQRCPVVRDD